MNKTIVTTTIYEPSEATLKFCEKSDWNFIIVGDSKTPHDAYRELAKKHSQVIYYHPDQQQAEYGELSNSIGWNCIQRRNLGLIKAYEMGSDIVATVDDDNIPFDNWGEHVHVGEEIGCDFYRTDNIAFDPLSVTDINHLWHRGFPIQLLASRKSFGDPGIIQRKALVQADLWNGDPDIDAMARLIHAPEADFSDITRPYCSNAISPFNSQNTFLAREVIPYYAVFPNIGRMDDIWGSYVLQLYFPDCVIYGPPSVYQDRNPQDLIHNLEMEIFGYRETLPLLKDLENFLNHLPAEARHFWKTYRGLYEHRESASGRTRL